MSEQIEQGIFSVLDVKANAYMTPFVFPSNGMAVRAFSDLVRDPQTALSKHPEDYSLYRVGTWLNETGVIVPEPHAFFMNRATEFVQGGTYVVEGADGNGIRSDDAEESV